METNVIKIKGVDASGNIRSYTDISIDYIKTIIETVGEEAAGKFLLEKAKEIIREIETVDSTA